MMKIHLSVTGLTLPSLFHCWKRLMRTSKKTEDGESRDTANRSAFVMEMFKLGLRVHENKLNKDASEKTLDQKLELIAKNALMNGFIIDAIFGIMKETVDTSKVVRNEMLLDPDWPKEMKERVAGKLLEYFK